MNKTIKLKKNDTLILTHLEDSFALKISVDKILDLKIETLTGHRGGVKPSLDEIIEWVEQQRIDRRLGKLKDWQIEKLDAAGFDWVGNKSD